jgi:catechol 2,3-dioxygenase-like lactoylglutathione lyase family enzyme
MPQIDHINIRVRDGKAMVAFLEAVIDGAREGDRPPFPHPGHWVYVDGKPQIHVDYLPPDAPNVRGLFDHIAFGVFDYAPLLERVKATGFRYDEAGIPGGAGQIFVFGPEGVKIELQFHR